MKGGVIIAANPNPNRVKIYAHNYTAHNVSIHQIYRLYIDFSLFGDPTKLSRITRHKKCTIYDYKNINVNYAILNLSK